MSHNHKHRDFRCPECGELVTCLSCLEIHAGHLPRGPAFTAEHYSIEPRVNSAIFETIGVADERVEPRTDIQHAPPIASSEIQRSLFV